MREKWAENQEYLQSAFTNKITNAGKKKIWADITTAINALGHETRTAAEIKHKWKNLSSVAKSTYSDMRKYQRGTGGGPPRPEPSNAIMKTIDLLKDSASFRGLPLIQLYQCSNHQLQFQKVLQSTRSRSESMARITKMYNSEF